MHSLIIFFNINKLTWSLIFKLSTHREVEGQCRGWACQGWGWPVLVWWGQQLAGWGSTLTDSRHRLDPGSWYNRMVLVGVLHTWNKKTKENECQAWLDSQILIFNDESLTKSFQIKRPSDITLTNISLAKVIAVPFCALVSPSLLINTFTLELTSIIPSLSLGVCLTLVHTHHCNKEI